MDRQVCEKCTGTNKPLIGRAVDRNCLLDIVALICILVVTVTSLNACIHAWREARREGRALREWRAQPTPTRAVATDRGAPSMKTLLIVLTLGMVFGVIASAVVVSYSADPQCSPSTTPCK
jgi:hypothetical protein